MVLLLIAGCTSRPFDDARVIEASAFDRGSKAGSSVFLWSESDSPTGVDDEPPAEVRLDPTRPRNLAELIDLAESRDPATRAAWERARAAAIAVGLVDGAYRPMLAASVVAGYERAVFPILEAPPLIDRNNFTAETAAITPGLELSWLIFDFGRRESLARAADARAVAADAGFSAAHRAVAWRVTMAYLQHATAIGAVKDAEVAVVAGRTLEEAVAARRAEGLATEVDVLRAVRSRVEAMFELESARSEVEKSRIDLLDAVGLPPGTPLQIAAIEDDPLPGAPTDVEDLVTEALAGRAEIAEAMAAYRASRADLEAARAGRRPTIRVGGDVSVPALAIDVENIGWASTIEPWYGAWVGVRVPLLDGELTNTEVRIALRNLAAAGEEVRAARNRVVREVWIAWIDLSNAIRRREVSMALHEASRASYEAALESFEAGIADVVTVDEARRGLADAREIDRATTAAIREAAATLAFATGRLAVSQP